MSIRREAMFYTIGETAGEIWQLLSNEGPMSFSAIARKTERPQRVVYMGIGWLAREDKLEFTQTKRGLAVSLKNVAG
jgi:predicted secreted Zn-dependent protease